MVDEILDLLKKARLVLALVLGAVLVYSSYGKLADIEGFARVVDNYEVLPGKAVNLVSVVVAGVEMAAGAALVVGLGLRQAGSAVAGALFAVFGVMAGGAVHRGLDVACGCFSNDPDSARVGWMTVGRSVLFLVMAVCVFVGEGVRERKGREGDGGMEAGEKTAG